MSPLSVENLKKIYGTGKEAKEALKGVTFDIESGEIFGLLGPNGAGKTSLISILTTLENPTSGTAKIFGEDVTLNKKSTKLSVGVVPQETISHGFFSVREVLEFQSGYFGLTQNAAQIERLLNKLQLKEHENKKILQLSGGMKRRFLIAKALVHKPKLLLLDEPTAGVDLELRTLLWQFVRELNAEGVTVLLTTHYLEEAERLCSRVAIVDHGLIRRIGPTSQLISQLTFRRVIMKFSGPVPDCESPRLIKRLGRSLEFQIPASMELGELLSEVKFGLEGIHDITIREGSLEDAMLNVLHTKDNATDSTTKAAK